MKLKDLIAADPSLADAEVLGTLPRTADGAIVGDEAQLWKIGHSNRKVEIVGRVNRCGHFSRFYSTRSAAERAGGGEQ